MINIVTIDNMYEDDGVNNLYGVLNNLILSPVETGKMRPAILGITFEYEEDAPPAPAQSSRLLRANVVTTDGTGCTGTDNDLQVAALHLADAGREIATLQTAARTKAVAALEAHPPTLSKGGTS